MSCYSCGSEDELQPFYEDLDICSECSQIRREIDQRWAEHDGPLREDAEWILRVNFDED